jgi:hypothetical protein
VRATGVTGVLRVGGRTAASLGRWSYDGSADGWKVEADTSSIDAYLFENGSSFELRLDVGEHVWRWRDVTVKGRSRVTVTGDGAPE